MMVSCYHFTKLGRHLPVIFYMFNLLIVYLINFSVYKIYFKKIVKNANHNFLKPKVLSSDVLICLSRGPKTQIY